MLVTQVTIFVDIAGCKNNVAVRIMDMNRDPRLTLGRETGWKTVPRKGAGHGHLEPTTLPGFGLGGHVHSQCRRVAQHFVSLGRRLGEVLAIASSQVE